VNVFLISPVIQESTNSTTRLSNNTIALIVPQDVISAITVPPSMDPCANYVITPNFHDMILPLKLWFARKLKVAPPISSVNWS
jgi:hypothetical protein